MKSLRGYGQKGPMVGPGVGTPAAPDPFVRFSLHGAQDKGLVKGAPEAALVATSMVIVHCVHCDEAPVSTQGYDADARCLQAACAPPGICGRDAAGAAPPEGVLVPVLVRCDLLCGQSRGMAPVRASLAEIVPAILCGVLLDGASSLVQGAGTDVCYHHFVLGHPEWPVPSVVA